MNKVTAVNLGGRAYQLEEDACARLQNYMKDAETRLTNDPGKAEIISDLEQAVAEKCDRFLSPAKNVVTLKEMEDILKEMGPVESSAGENPEQPKPEGENKDTKQEPHKINRLYKIREEGIIGGVCAGLGAYLHLDPTLIRLGFILLTLLSWGGWVVVYIVLMFIMPSANTSAEKAAAFGAPFTAQDWIKQARQGFTTRLSARSKLKQLKRELKQKIREERRARVRNLYVSGGFWSSSPIFGLLRAVVAVLWVIGLITLIGHGSLFGVMVHPPMPLWVALVLWVFLYALVSAPLKAMRYHVHCGDGDSHVYIQNHGGLLDSAIQIVILAGICWALWHYLPDTHPYFIQFHDWCTQIWASMKGA